MLHCLPNAVCKLSLCIASYHGAICVCIRIHAAGVHEFEDAIGSFDLPRLEESFHKDIPGVDVCSNSVRIHIFDDRRGRSVLSLSAEG